MSATKRIITKNFYELCVEFSSFIQKIDKSSCLHQKKSISFTEAGEGLLTAEYILYLENFPYKAVSTKKSKAINILVRARDRYSKRELISYNTEVLYTEIDKPGEFKNKNVFLEGLHFDFDEQILPAHPVFHAQRNSTVLVDVAASHYSEYMAGEADRLHKGIRIPTPQMDGFSSVIMLIADHLVKPADSAAFLSFLRTVEAMLPKAALTEGHGLFNNQLPGYANIRPACWYAHKERREDAA